MKRLLMVGIAILCLLCGCQAQKQPPASVVEPYTYTSKVLYFIEGDTIQAVDLDGRLITVENPQDIQLPEGSRAEEAVEIQVHADGTASMVLDYPYSFTYQHPIRASREEAPEAYARAKLDEMMGSTIWAYTITDIAVVKETEGRIDFLMTYDLELARNAAEFSAYSPYDGHYGQGTMLTGQKHAVSLLGNGEQWLSYEPFFLGDRQQLAVPKYADFVPEDDQTALFATEQAIYYQEKTYLPQSEAAAADQALAEYDTVLWAQERSTGQRYALSEGLRNYDFSFEDHAEGKIYLKAHFWEPYSESFPGGIFVIEEASRQVRQLQEDAVVVAMTKDAIYTMQSRYEADRWAIELYAIDQSTAELRRLCSIPELNESGAVRLFHVNGQTMWLEQYDMDNHKEVFAIDLVSGDYQKMA